MFGLWRDMPLKDIQHYADGALKKLQPRGEYIKCILFLLPTVSA